MTATAADLRALIAEAEGEGAMLAELRELYDGIDRVASHVGEATVALLSALPLVRPEAAALGFLSDAMEANAAAMADLLSVQAVGRQLSDAQGERIAVLDTRLHSIRAELAS